MQCFAVAGVAPNLIHFTQLIDLYSKRGDQKSLEKATKLYGMMRQKGIPPSEVTLSCLIDACCQTGDVDQAFRYYSEAAEAGLAALRSIEGAPVKQRICNTLEAAKLKAALAKANGELKALKHAAQGDALNARKPTTAKAASQKQPSKAQAPPPQAARYP